MCLPGNVWAPSRPGGKTWGEKNSENPSDSNLTLCTYVGRCYSTTVFWEGHVEIICFKHPTFLSLGNLLVLTFPCHCFSMNENFCEQFFSNILRELIRLYN